MMWASSRSPRPPATVTTQRTGDGRLQVTVTAGTQGSNGANHLSELRFGAGTNALIDAGGDRPHRPLTGRVLSWRRRAYGRARARS